MEGDVDTIVRFSEYDGMLPKPSHFPSSTRIPVEGYPYALTNYYILDLFASDKPNKDTTPIPHKPMQKIIDITKKGKPLSEPQYVGTENDYEFFILFNPDRQTVAIQTKFYQYFYYRYKGCLFVATTGQEPVGVTHKGSIVGVIMPMLVTCQVPFYEE